MRDSLWVLLAIASFLMGAPVLPSCAASSGGGSGIGNGGDTIYCAPSTENPFSGYFTLDYLLEHHDAGALSDLAEVTSWGASKQRLSKLFLGLYPEVHPHFTEFANLVENTTQLDAPRVWIPRPLGLEDIKDENITRKLPGNCLDYRNGALSPQITQTVIRRMGNPAIEYEFDPAILTRQKRDNPMQYSFFMVHEWLWDTTDDVDSIRKINWLLHSKQADGMSPEQFQRLLRSYGLFNRKLGTCEKSEALKIGIARVFSDKPCDTFELDRLRALNRLDLSSLSIRFPFRAGDFYGFEGVETLALSDNSALLAKVYPEFFSTLYSLKTLDLSACTIDTLPESLTRGLKYLETLDLTANPLARITPSFRSMTGLKTLRLSVSNPRLLSNAEEAENLPRRLQILELGFNEAQKPRSAAVTEIIRTARPGIRVVLK